MYDIYNPVNSPTKGLNDTYNSLLGGNHCGNKGADLIPDCTLIK